LQGAVGDRMERGVLDQPLLGQRPERRDVPGQDTEITEGEPRLDRFGGLFGVLLRVLTDANPLGLPFPLVIHEQPPRALPLAYLHAHVTPPRRLISADSPG